MLAGGGSYVTLVPPPDGHIIPAKAPEGQISDSQIQSQISRTSLETFTMIVETLHGSCGHQGHCNTKQITATQSLSFALQGPLSNVSTVHLWCSSRETQFVYNGTAKLLAGSLLLVMPPDTICTATTLSNLTNGSKGAHPHPPASQRFPTAHRDDFYSYKEDALAWGFADVYGSFAVRATPHNLNGTTAGNALTQVATSTPTGWAPHNYDPLTVIGDEQWSDVQVNATVLINHTQPHHYVQLCGGCGGANVHGIKFFCPPSCCFNLSWTGAVYSLYSLYILYTLYILY
jgi:hypothetical protein